MCGYDCRIDYGLFCLVVDDLLYGVVLERPVVDGCPVVKVKRIPRRAEIDAVVYYAAQGTFGIGYVVEGDAGCRVCLDFHDNFRHLVFEDEAVDFAAAYPVGLYSFLRTHNVNLAL